MLSVKSSAIYAIIGLMLISEVSFSTGIGFTDHVGAILALHPGDK